LAIYQLFFFQALSAIRTFTTFLNNPNSYTFETKKFRAVGTYMSLRCFFLAYKASEYGYQAAVLIGVRLNHLRKLVLLSN
jgi:hypothetical protein